jgi:CBS domain-containing protein
MTVKEILSHKGVDVVTADPHASIADAVKLLAARRIGAVVVTGADRTGADRRIVGILSERDIVRALADKGPDALAAPVAEVMTRKVDTCSLNQTVSELMEQMTSGKFRHVPVVEQGRLAGIISIGDVVKSRVQEMEQESAALKDYIRTA